MTNHATTSSAVDLHGATRPGPALILCEHASNHIPARYNGLGLDAEARKSHAAWDPGALAVARHLSDALNAPLIASAVSRLVYDCNRPPEAPSAMPTKSELIEVPGNQNLTKVQRQERVDSVTPRFATPSRRKSPAKNPKF